ncbi:MAG: phenylalanine--tRNA ligase subunit beta [Candidatus Diapherotrites archaeon]|nr:phenylalanine--tRNA ligase subunit beta [Candidatus Diapherotrites archaeon]
MPKLEISKKDLEILVGKKFKDMEELEEVLMYAKVELDGQENDKLFLDAKDTNRPDLWSAEGIARQLKASLGLKKGLPKYDVRKSNLKVKIEASVKDVRPLTYCAIIKDVKITEESLIQMIQLQEKVAMTFGRKRKEAAIGIYDYDKIKGNIRFYGADPKTKKFVPLEFKEELTLEEILELHPKGIEYGHLLKGKEVYPIFEDSEGNVLSMPPIINSNYSGKVTEETKNLFIEVSGFKEETISTALNVLVTAFADRGGKIFSVKVIDSNGKERWTPDLRPKKIEIEIDDIKKLSGLNLKNKEILELLKKMCYDVNIKGNKIFCEYPAYRNDILHHVDVIEDVIIAYGYNKIEPEKLNIPIIGYEKEETRYIDTVREVCIGLKLQEVLTFTLTSKAKQSDLVYENKEDLVEILNPISENWSVFRKNIFPELLEFLEKNKNAEYPQNIFEIGKTIKLDEESETGVCEKDKLCIVLTGRDYNYTKIKSFFDAINENLDLNLNISEGEIKFLESGKSAYIMKGDKKIGFIGELNKNVLKKFKLKFPVVLLEFELVVK